MNDHGALKKLRQKLLGVDPRWVYDLYRKLMWKELCTTDEVCVEYLSMLADTGRGHELIDRTIEVCTRHLTNRDHIADICIITIVFLSYFPQVAKSVIERSMRDQNYRANLKIILVRIQRNGIQVLAGDAALFSPEMAIQSLGDQQLFRVVVPFRLLKWTEEILTHATIQATAMDVAVHLDVPVVTDDMFEELWCRIRQDAKYTLHGDGDRIDFRIDRLLQANVRSVVLRPNGVFPNANLDLVLGNSDAEGILEARLESGRLIGIDHMWTDEFRAYVGYVISVGYLHIVNGGLYEENHHLYCRHGGAVGVQCKRVARPHPLKLRPNFKPSQDAIDQCIERLGRAPFPGYTFRVPTKGAVLRGDQRGIINLTEDMCKRYTAV